MSTETAIAWLPSPQDVANLLRARTKDDEGRELGAWTDTTRPTADEVERTILTAAGDLLTAVDTLDPDHEDEHGAARSLCAKRAAMLIELSYHPDDASQPGSVYAEYRQQWDDGVKALIGKLAGPPGGGSTYSVQVQTATRHYTDDWPKWPGWVVAEEPMHPIEKPPVARFTWTPEQPVAGEPITFDASASTPAELIERYLWQAPLSGAEREGKVIEVQLPAGTHIIWLQVFTSDGRHGQSLQQLDVVEF